MDKFIINEDEKNRILNLHESASKRQYLPEQEKILQNEKIVTNHDKTYDYKKSGEEYFYKLKNAKDWTKASGKGLDAIKTKVYGTGDPSKSGSNVGKSETAFPFTTNEEGNKFRAWMNKYYPKTSKSLQLDPTGLFNNSYMKKAWNTSLDKSVSTKFGVSTYGDLYNKQVLKSSNIDKVGKVTGKKKKNDAGYYLSKNQEAVGKIAYVKGDFVNLRSSPKVDDGGFTRNKGEKVNGKNKVIGKVKSVVYDTGGTSKKWYQIDGEYVREDVVTLK